MKCKQKLCQRTKNIKQSGNCNVCGDAIADAMKNEVKTDSKPTENVEIDIDLMIDTHNKLSEGIPIDPKVISGLLLGGVINIINQHDKIADIEEKMKLLSSENVTNNVRIEMLENWVQKQGEVIKKLDDKLATLDKNGVIFKENEEIQTIQKKMLSLEEDLGSLKVMNTKSKKSNTKIDQTFQNSKSTKCSQCEETFSRNCDLENHFEVHQIDKEHTCNVCGKQFFLQWRLRKHMQMHTENAPFCHFYNNGKLCPFQEIGCMFRHENSGPCKRRLCTRKLCQFQHYKNIEAADNHNQEIVSDKIDKNYLTDGKDKIDEYECHLCNEIHPSQDSLKECCDHQDCSPEECCNPAV